jgi:hypothetical protein
MTRLTLVGVARDRKRLGRLGKKLQSLEPALAVRVKTPGELLREKEPPTDIGAGETENARNIICWTRNSTGQPGEALAAFALTLKEHYSYSGLLLDDVQPPEAVRNANDIRIVGWDGEEDAVILRPFLEGLARAGRTGSVNPEARRWLTLWRGFLGALQAIERRVARVQSLALLGIALSVLAYAASLVFNYGDSRANLCKVDALHGLCSRVGWIRLPGDAERKAFAAAKAGDACAPFREYLRSHGPAGFFADEARQRLSLATHAPVRQRLPVKRLPMSVSWATEPASTLSRARAALVMRSEIEARTFCANMAQNLAGEYAPGRFAANGAPICENNGEGYVCRTRGYAECSFVQIGTEELCR